MPSQTDNSFKYLQNQLYFNNISIANISKNRKTPYFLYSEESLLRNIKIFKKLANDAFSKNIICYAYKANNNADVLNTISKNKIGADVVSLNELKLALKNNVPASKIVFSGIGKTRSEIRNAIKLTNGKILSINTESYDEVITIFEESQKLKTKVNISFRFNPNVDVKTHPYISTGKGNHKFGLNLCTIKKLISMKDLWKQLKLVGISIHIGSQLTNLQATKSALKKACKLYIELNKEFKLIYFDVGGGLGINYSHSKTNKIANINKYFDTIKTIIDNYFPLNKPIIIFEPGRILSANIGIIVTRVIRNKTINNENFVIIDAGMTELIRPALYQVYHKIFSTSKKQLLFDQKVVGPICETSDYFGIHNLPNSKEDDLLVIADCGAYGSVMSSRYNIRNKSKEYFAKKTHLNKFY